MHIVHICGALKGGPLSIIADWTYQQTHAGHRVTLFYSPLRDPVEDVRRALSPKIELIPLEVRRDIHPGSDIPAIFRLISSLRRIKPDILHLHSSKAGAIGRIAARAVGIPAVYSPHAVSFLRTDVTKLTRTAFYGMEWLLGALGGVTVACSASELQAMRPIPGRKMVIPNGVDLATMPPLPGKIDDKEGLDIVLCGRITAQKNPRLACEVARQSPRHWRWTWLGDGEMKEVVQSSGRIAVSGWMPRTEALLRLGASDVMVHTSSWEGMPLAVLEAMAQAVPVVATDVVGNRDLVVPGETGFVASTPAEFLEALERLAASTDLRYRFGAAARKRVETDFNQAKLAAQWAALYDSLLNAVRLSTTNIPR